jgi:hypothetical protein
MKNNLIAICSALVMILASGCDKKEYSWHEAIKTRFKIEVPKLEWGTHYDFDTWCIRAVFHDGKIHYYAPIVEGLSELDKKD